MGVLFIINPLSIKKPLLNPVSLLISLSLSFHLDHLLLLSRSLSLERQILREPYLAGKSCANLTSLLLGVLYISLALSRALSLALSPSISLSRSLSRSLSLSLSLSLSFSLAPQTSFFKHLYPLLSLASSNTSHPVEVLTSHLSTLKISVLLHQSAARVQPSRALAEEEKHRASISPETREISGPCPSHSDVF